MGKIARTVFGTAAAGTALFGAYHMAHGLEQLNTQHSADQTEAAQTQQDSGGAETLVGLLYGTFGLAGLGVETHVIRDENQRQARLALGNVAVGSTEA